MESRKSRSGRAASIMVVLLLCASLLPPTTAQPWALVERTALLDFKDGDTGVNYYLSETPSALEQPALELWACVAPTSVRHSLTRRACWRRRVLGCDGGLLGNVDGSRLGREQLGPDTVRGRLEHERVRLERRHVQPRERKCSYGPSAGTRRRVG